MRPTSLQELAARKPGQSLWDRHDSWWPSFLTVDNWGPITPVSAASALFLLREAGVYAPVNKVVYCTRRPDPNTMTAVCIYDGDYGYVFQISLGAPEESPILNPES